jgi:hypothetical protein
VKAAELHKGQIVRLVPPGKKQPVTMELWSVATTTFLGDECVEMFGERRVRDDDGMWVTSYRNYRSVHVRVPPDDEIEVLNTVAVQDTVTTTVRFFKTNRVDDPGFEMATDEIARQFWASDVAKEWVANPGIRLGRIAVMWVAEHIGHWENVPDDWHAIEDAILEIMPRNDINTNT